MKKFILAFDQGTSSSRAVLFDHQHEIVGIDQKETSQIYPNIGWVEQLPDDIYESQVKVAQHLIKRFNISPNEIACIGITNQRETTIVWEKSTGKPIYNAIVWQDKRTSDNCNFLKKEGLTNYIHQTTGLFIDSYFSATKIQWILQNVPGASQKALYGELLFGTIDTWLLWKLTNGKCHFTDYSNASRTMLYDIHKLEWDQRLLDIFGIPKNILPEVRMSSEIYGDTKILGGAIIPICGLTGDQQAALFGQTCFEPGTAKNTYGTGCFMLMNTGNRPIYSKSGLLTTIAWGINGNIEYALEGSIFNTGASIKWLRDGLKLIHNVSDTETIANELEDSGEIYVIPSFSGLGAPYWDMDVRGAILGLTQGISWKHIVRATLESIAYQTKDVLNAMTIDSEIELKLLNADGGACMNNFLMQFQADIINTNVVRPQNIETTALGAAFLAGLAVNFWDKNSLLTNRKIDKVFKPDMAPEKRSCLYTGWLKAIEGVRAVKFETKTK